MKKRHLTSVPRDAKPSRRPPPPTAPDAPPPFADLAAHKAQLEADRAALFVKWKAALAQHEGNSTHAALALFYAGEERTRVAGRAKSRGLSITKRLGLREYAAELRVRAGRTKLGRQWPSDGVREGLKK